MNTQEIIDRLKEHCPAFSNRVAGSADYDLAIDSNTFATPCAYVIELSESSESNTLLNGFSQRITSQIGVMMIVSNRRDANDYAAHLQLQDIRQEVKDALCNWQPEMCSMPFEHLTGRSNGSYDLNRFWADVFTTQFYYRT